MEILSRLKNIGELMRLNIGGVEKVQHEQLQGLLEAANLSALTFVLDIATFKVIPQLVERSETLGEWEHAVEFSRVMALMGDQLVKVGSISPRIANRFGLIEKGREVVEHWSDKSREIINEHVGDIDPGIVARQDFFTGKARAAMGDYLGAIEFYRTSIDKLIGAGKPEIALEVQAKLAEVTILNAQTDMGLRQGINTGFFAFEAFGNDDGEKLKLNSPETSINWQAMAAISMADALVEQDSLDLLSRDEAEKLVNNLRKAYADGKALSPLKFAVRKTQLIKTWNKLKNLSLHSCVGSIDKS